MGYTGSNVKHPTRPVRGACGKDFMMLVSAFTALALLVTRQRGRG